MDFINCLPLYIAFCRMFHEQSQNKRHIGKSGAGEGLKPFVPEKIVHLGT
jgi:hypothetical protein